VVLVNHDVEAELVCEHPFVEAMVIVLGHHARIAVAARQITRSDLCSGAQASGQGCSEKW